MVHFSVTFAIVFMEIRQQYFGAVQLMLDEYLDSILDETSNETETTVDDDDVSM